MPNPLLPNIGSADPMRLIESLARMAAVGTTRLAYSPEDIKGREVAIQIMREATLAVRVDAAGNIVGERPGRAELAPIMFGSHIDTVRNGGRFDGVLGVMAGIECVHVLNTMGHQTEHPLSVVIFENEEGQTYAGLSGSRGLVNGLSREELESTDRDGRPLCDAIACVGGSPERLTQSSLPPLGVHAYVELHIEQGGELERTLTAIGIVEGISGIHHTDVVLQGVANHAGTTSMIGRRDALVAAAALVLEVQKLAGQHRLCRVATVGQMFVLPNSKNIIPGEVHLVVELRDVDNDRIHAALQRLRSVAAEIELNSGVRIQLEDRELASPVPAARSVQHAIAASCEELGYTYASMHSGAGHDAQILGRVAPMGMIFVPSIGGISHSPDESTSYGDCVRGTNVLLHTILRLDAVEAFPADEVVRR